MPVVVKGHFLVDKRQNASSCVRVRFIIPKLFFLPAESVYLYCQKLE